MRSLVVVAAALVLLSSSSAFAQPGLNSPSTPAPLEPGDKDPAVAVLLAVGATVGGFVVLSVSADKENVSGMIAGGAMLAIGPSAGHMYLGRTDRVVGMSIVRAAGLGLQLLGTIQFAEGIASSFGLCEPDECRNPNAGNGLILMLVGATIWSVGTALDFRDAPRAARRHNASRRGLAMSPGYMRTPSGTGVPMLALGGRF